MRGRNRPRKRNAQGKKAHCEQALEESSAAERRGPPSGPSVQQAFLSSCTRGPLSPANTASAQALIPVGNLSDWALCCRLVSLQPHSVTLNTASVCGVTVGPLRAELRAGRDSGLPCLPPSPQQLAQRLGRRRRSAGVYATHGAGAQARQEPHEWQVA